MMTGSCVTSNEYWLETTGVLFDTIAKVRAELGIEFEFMNIGGGLGIPYRPGEPEVQPSVIAPSIAKVFAQKRAEHGLADMPAPTLYMECGRYITGPFGWLAARCKATKSAMGQRYFGLDACMANCSAYQTFIAGWNELLSIIQTATSLLESPPARIARR